MMGKVLAVLFLCACVRAAVFSGKEYFCRDPDTGKLHPTNSTWTSTTFCGNYTCKLRKKLNALPSLPLRELNISSNSIPSQSNARSSEVIFEHDQKSTNLEHNNLDINAQKTLKSVEDVLSVSKLPKEHSDLIANLIHSNSKKDSPDRFLTEKEIQAISDLLHNIKKSDLDVIVDIYNLAQDIYKEMDIITNENLIKETLQGAQFSVGNYNKDHVFKDMESQGTDVIPSTLPPIPIAYPYSYYQGYTDNNYRNHHYPKPVPQNQPLYLPFFGQQVIHQAKPQNSFQAFQIHEQINKPPSPVETLKSYNEPKPLGLLPFPFSHTHKKYNTTAYPFNYFLEKDPSHKCDTHSKAAEYFTPDIIMPLNNLITKRNDEKKTKIPDEKPKVNVELEAENFFENIIPSTKVNSKNRPDWQTDPLPNDVLEEIRAHILKKNKIVKPLSLRKKVKLEKVGKVLKLDDLKRKKRSVADNKHEDKSEFEPYVEKTECPLDFTPGYFRMGDESQPYPECCPHKIIKSK